MFCRDWPDGPPVTKKLDIWPALPIVVEKFDFTTPWTDNIIPALEHNDRVLQIDLRQLEPSPELENVVAVMQEPFVSISLNFYDGMPRTDLVIPNSFLGGSTPRLEHLRLNGFPFPGLPKLVSSATNLVYLEL
jgi:hypothetical protein